MGGGLSSGAGGDGTKWGKTVPRALIDVGPAHICKVAGRARRPPAQSVALTPPRSQLVNMCGVGVVDPIASTQAELSSGGHDGGGARAGTLGRLISSTGRPVASTVAPRVGRVVPHGKLTITQLCLAAGKMPVCIVMTEDVQVSPLLPAAASSPGAAVRAGSAGSQHVGDAEGVELVTRMQGVAGGEGDPFRQEVGLLDHSDDAHTFRLPGPTT